MNYFASSDRGRHRPMVSDDIDFDRLSHRSSFVSLIKEDMQPVLFLSLSTYFDFTCPLNVTIDVNQFLSTITTLDCLSMKSDHHSKKSHDNLIRLVFFRNQ